jgi:hypothetical protein
MWTIDQDLVKDEEMALDRWYPRRSRILQVPGDHTNLEQSFNDFQDVVKGKYVKTMATITAVETIPRIETMATVPRVETTATVPLIETAATIPPVETMRPVSPGEAIVLHPQRSNNIAAISTTANVRHAQDSLEEWQDLMLKVFLIWLFSLVILIEIMPISPVSTTVTVGKAIVLEARRALARLYTFIRRKYDATVRIISLEAQRFYISKAWVKKILLWIGVLLLFLYLWPTNSIVSTQVNAPAGCPPWTPTEIKRVYEPESAASSRVTAVDHPVYDEYSLLTLPFSFFQWALTYYRDRGFGTASSIASTGDHYTVYEHSPTATPFMFEEY